MKLTPTIHKAINTATKLHFGAKRKTDDTPFIVHPFSVAWILSEVTDDEDLIAAALLHDVLEDVKGYREEDMIRDFGPRITGLVKDVSEDKDPNVEYDEKATWKKRKEGYIAHLRTAQTDSMLISCADKIHNLTCLLRDYQERGEEIWKLFNASKEEKNWYESTLMEIFQGVDDERMKPLLKEYERLIEEIQTISNQNTMTNIGPDELNEWASKLSLEEIENLSDEEILKYRMERPGHPGAYGFMLDISSFESAKHFSEISHALMERLKQVDSKEEEYQEKLEAMKISKPYAKIVEYSEYNENEALICSDCNWQGLAKDGVTEYFDALLHVECPKCEKILIIAEYPIA